VIFLKKNLNSQLPTPATCPSGRMGPRWAQRKTGQHDRIWIAAMVLPVLHLTCCKFAIWLITAFWPASADPFHEGIFRGPYPETWSQSYVRLLNLQLQTTPNRASDKQKALHSNLWDSILGLLLMS
jgi:hypothetical protein